MEKFNRALRGYDPDEVNKFLDQIISQVEKMVAEIKEKDKLLNTLKDENESLKDKITHYENLESTLNRAILMSQKTSDKMRQAATLESETILNNAKENANRILNEALMRAEKTELEANMLKRNINIFKRRLKDIIEAQLEVVSEIEKVEL